MYPGYFVWDTGRPRQWHPEVALPRRSRMGEGPPAKELPKLILQEYTRVTHKKKKEDEKLVPMYGERRQKRS